MFQVEQRFERQMINFGEKDRPIRHYPIAEVVAGHLVLQIIGTQPIQEPDGHVYKRRTHLMVTKVGIAAEILNQNKFEEVAVFAVIPPLSPSSPAPAVKRCTAIFECRDKNYPDTKAWGCEFGAELFIDPTDDVDLKHMTRKKCFGYQNNQALRRLFTCPDSITVISQNPLATTMATLMAWLMALPLGESMGTPRAGMKPPYTPMA